LLRIKISYMDIKEKMTRDIIDSEVAVAAAVAVVLMHSLLYCYCHCYSCHFIEFKIEYDSPTMKN
jgi:hypothetical protein